MLTITIPSTELWDEENQEFIYTKSCVIQLEHSLVSISKWEAKWNKPFLSKVEKTKEELIDYIKCMTITQNVDQEVYKYLSKRNFEQINKYLEAPMSATTFSNNNQTGRANNEKITSELIYYWMIAQNIPFECQKWHINRLLTLIRICNIKNAAPKKHSKNDLLRRNAALNAERRKALNTTG